MKNASLKLFIILLLSTTAFTARAAPDEALQKFAGMWSDPPGFLGVVCFVFCTDASIENAYALLDDPANDETPLSELFNEEVIFGGIGAMMFPLLTETSRQTFPVDLSREPGFINCEPWSFGREIFAPHQNQITVFDDHIQMRYGEWDVTRFIWLDGRAAPSDLPHSLYGFSTGHMEGDTLVINTTHLSADILMHIMNHSDQLTAVERYSVVEDGAMLLAQVTFTDPVALSGPLSINKYWGWAPNEQIFPYESCEIPTDYIESQGIR
jgi:hypothetical protein